MDYSLPGRRTVSGDPERRGRGETGPAGQLLRLSGSAADHEQRLPAPGHPAGLLITVKEESEKAGLKLRIRKTKIMASSPITSWQIDGETMETVTDFISGGSKITLDGDCSHEIKRCLLLGRKAMTNLDSILKSRHHFVNKGI